MPGLDLPVPDFHLPDLRAPDLRALGGRLSPDGEGRFSPSGAAALAIGFVGVAGLIAAVLPGVQNDPKRFLWYRKLDKPKATPPDPVFGIAWPLIQMALAYGGYRLLRAPASPRRNRALGLLAFNVSLIPGYQLLFFTARSLTGGLAVATALVAGAWTYVAAAAPVDRRAAQAGLPLALWTSFAEYLMAEVWRRNRR
jgi:translocator protein